MKKRAAETNKQTGKRVYKGPKLITVALEQRVATLDTAVNGLDVQVRRVDSRISNVESAQDLRQITLEDAIARVTHSFRPIASRRENLLRQAQKLLQELTERPTLSRNLEQRAREIETAIALELGR